MADNPQKVKLRTIDQAVELDAGAIHKARERDPSRSGDAIRLAYQIKVVNRGTFEDFCEAIEADSELSIWREENLRKQGGDRQVYRAWAAVKSPPGYDDVFDRWRPVGRFPLTRFIDVKLDTQSRYIVQGLLPREGLVVAWGPPKCGKSFWATDIGLHVSLGWDYRGRRVEQGVVIYVACEGQAGVPQRIEAFKQTRLAENPEANPPFFILPTQLNLITEAKKLIEEIGEQLGAETPIMIVLDTLNRSLVGSESKDEDMSAYIAACEQIRQAFNCLVMIIHHCGIEGTRPRGHTSLTGAVDAQIAILKRSDATVAKVEFMKDGEEGDEIISRLKTVVVGTDVNGLEITSCVVEEAEDLSASPSHVTKLPPSEHHAFAIFNELYAKGNVTRSEFRQACISSNKLSASDNPKSQAKAFERACLGLVRRHLIMIEGEDILLFQEGDL